MEIHEPIDQKKQLNIIAIADDSVCGRNAYSSHALWFFIRGEETEIHKSADFPSRAPPT